jgi:hypothetical protein
MLRQFNFNFELLSRSCLSNLGQTRHAHLLIQAGWPE